MVEGGNLIPILRLPSNHVDDDNDDGHWDGLQTLMSIVQNCIMPSR